MRPAESRGSTALHTERTDSGPSTWIPYLRSTSTEDLFSGPVHENTFHDNNPLLDRKAVVGGSLVADQDGIITQFPRRPCYVARVCSPPRGFRTNVVSIPVLLTRRMLFSGSSKRPTRPATRPSAMESNWRSRVMDGGTPGDTDANNVQTHVDGRSHSRRGSDPSAHIRYVVHGCRVEGGARCYCDRQAEQGNEGGHVRWSWCNFHGEPQLERYALRFSLANSFIIDRLKSHIAIKGFERDSCSTLFTRSRCPPVV